MQNAMNAEKTTGILFTSSKLILLVLGINRGVCPLTWLPLGFLVTPTNPHLITCDYLKLGLWVSFKPHWRSLHVLKGFSFHSSLGRWCKNLVVTQCVFRLSFKMLLNHPHKISKNVTKFTDSTSSVSKNKYLHTLFLSSWPFSVYTKIANRTKHTAT